MIDTASQAVALYGPNAEAPAASSTPPPADSKQPDASATRTEVPVSESAEDSDSTSAADPVVKAPVITAEQVKAAIPADVAADRAQDPMRKHYDVQATYAHVLPDSLFGLPHEGRGAVAAEVREMAADIGATTQDAEAIVSAMQRTPVEMTQAQRVASREACVEAFNNAFGQDAYKTWIDTRKFVAQDPRRAALLASVGDHPKVALRIAQLARQAKAQGKLR